MQTKRWIRAGQLAAALVVVALTGVLVSGAPSTSTNFSMDDMSNPGAAGDAFSTNFHVSATIPESAAGIPASSTNFTITTEFVPPTYGNGDITPPVITAGPTAIYLADDRALIEWTTDENADGTVDYGLTTAYGSSQSQTASFTTLHQVLITGLTASTTYNYQVNSTDPFSNGPTTSTNAQFTTAAAPDTTNPSFTSTTVTPLSLTSVQIDFTVDEPCTTDLDYGLTTGLGTVLSDAAFRTSNTRTITGLTPGTQYFFDITATDPSGNSNTNGIQTFTMPVAVNITTSSLPDGTRTVFYTATVMAQDGVGALSYTLDAGALPPGLILDGPTGVISGTPTTNGSYSFDIRVTDSGTTTSSDVAAYTVNIGDPSGGGGGKDDSKCSTAEGSGLSWMLLLGLLAGMAVIARNARRDEG
ncbi:MAG: putative Ig domain-containing protein [Planctomycetes bacterium]|nr:putative Ig domain-containing protein [Planctomycetota bacterium]